MRGSARVVAAVVAVLALAPPALTAAADVTLVGAPQVSRLVPGQPAVVTVHGAGGDPDLPVDEVSSDARPLAPGPSLERHGAATLRPWDHVPGAVARDREEDLA